MGILYHKSNPMSTPRGLLLITIKKRLKIIFKRALTFIYRCDIIDAEVEFRPQFDYTDIVAKHEYPTDR